MACWFIIKTQAQILKQNALGQGPNVPTVSLKERRMEMILNWFIFVCYKNTENNVYYRQVYIQGFGGGETVISVNHLHFLPCGPAMTSHVVRRNGVEHFWNLAHFRVVKIPPPARGGGKRVKIRLCTSQRAVPLWNRWMKSALNEQWRILWGWPLSFLILQDNLSSPELCPNVSTFSPCLMPSCQSIIS